MATGKILILRWVMIANYVTKFYIHNLVGSEYVWKCVFSISYMVLSLMGGGTLKFGANLEGLHST